MDMQTKRTALRAMEALIANQALIFTDWYRESGTVNDPEGVTEFFHLVDQYAKLLKARVRHG